MEKKLSELMREGAKLYPKVTGSYISFNKEDKHIEGCCAIGAAIIARYGKEHLKDSESYRASDFIEEIGVSNVRLSPPSGNTYVFPEKDYQLEVIVYRLNDHADWTREQIADWLESIGY